MGVPINPQAAILFNKYVAPFDRVLVLGAGGWFGKTAIAMLDSELLAEKNFSFIGRKARSESVNGQVIEFEAWSDEILKHRRPELVLDFAFLTRDFASAMGLSRYNEMNKELSARLLRAARFDSVRCILSASSGAATQTRIDEFMQSELKAYGGQKKSNETELARISEWRGLPTSIARAWSVTGGFVRRPELYAFSDLIDSVLRENVMIVKSSHPVYRRFCAVDDLLSLSMAETACGEFTVVESGGPLVEMRELARAIANQVGDHLTQIQVPPFDSSRGDHYYSNNQSWSEMCKKHSFRPLDLEKQIQNVSEALKNRQRDRPIL